MFNNIARKIKILAMVIAAIGVAASIVFGFSFLKDEEYLIGILVIVVGSAISCASVFTLYGFGHLIENTDKLVENSCRQDESRATHFCDKCGYAVDVNDEFCPNCKRKLK